MQQLGWILKDILLSAKANRKKLYIVQFHLYGICEMRKLHEWRADM